MRSNWFCIIFGIAAAVAISAAGCAKGGSKSVEDGAAKAPAAATHAAAGTETATPAAAQAATVKDPVCGMNLTAGQVVATYEHEGKTYSFCMQSDRDAFAADPAKYLKADAAGMHTGH